MTMKKSLFLQLVIMLFVSATITPFSVSAETEKDSPTIKELLEQGDTSAEAKASNQASNQAAKMVATLSPDQYNRQTPRSSIDGLATAMQEGNYELAMKYMDTRYIPSDVASLNSELARQLKIIASRSIWVSIDIFSEDPSGHVNDGLPSYRDLITTLQTPDGPINLLMQRVPGDEKGTQVWKISNQTVAEIPRLYELYGYGPIGDYLSQIIPEKEIFVFQLWQWLLLGILISVAYTVAWLLTGLINLFLRRHPNERAARQQKFFKGPIRFLLVVVLVRSNLDLVAPSLEAKAVIELQTFVIIALTWLFMGIITLVMGSLADRMLKAGNENATVLLRPAATAIKVMVIFIAGLNWFQNMGYNVSTLLAGLGIGSVAVALAAQKSIENLIGSITLYAAQPIHIGDLCKYQGTLGIVEEIGLRSTRIRTLERTVKHIPNAMLSSIEIENFIERDRFLYKHTIKVSIDTTPDQLRYILMKGKEMLLAHPMISPDPARIRFPEFGDSSLNLQIFAYIQTSDFNEYLEVTEDLHLKFMDIIQDSGTTLAVPSRMNYNEDQGRVIDEERRKRAEAQVKEWEENKSAD